jgi:hypothetical protein
LLRDRSLKEGALEMNMDQLHSKRALLVSLKKEEEESERINNALRGSKGSLNASTERATGTDTSQDDATTTTQEIESNSGRPEANDVMRRSVSSRNRSSVINMISTTINNFIETDPVVSRKMNIEKTKNKIEEVSPRRMSSAV